VELVGEVKRAGHKILIDNYSTYLKLCNNLHQRKNNAYGKFTTTERALVLNTFN
jgi:hypothetical protein